MRRRLSRTGCPKKERLRFWACSASSGETPGSSGGRAKALQALVLVDVLLSPPLPPLAVRFRNPPSWRFRV